MDENIEFIISGDIWTIEKWDKEKLLELYRKEVNDEATFAFGVCKYPEHKIIINKDMCFDQQIKTLKHELTHCWIFNSGLYNAPHYTEEMVCDIVMGISEFIEEIAKMYRERI